MGYYSYFPFRCCNLSAEAADTEGVVMMKDLYTMICLDCLRPISYRAKRCRKCGLREAVNRPEVKIKIKTIFAFRSKKILRICKQCGKEFFAFPSRVKDGKGKFCSFKCIKSQGKIKRMCLYCGKEFSWRRGHGKGKFCRRLCQSKYQVGKNNPFWHGGGYKNVGGYIFAYAPKHPKQCHGYVYKHRLVMEQILGRFLMDEEVVHHKNRIRSDNQPENLFLFDSGTDHRKYHVRQRKGL
jgi:ribosomal protein L40E